MEINSRKEYEFPTDIWCIINLYLGHKYWENRKELTYLSQALDFSSSNYIYHSYWTWYKWREKLENSWYLGKRLMKPKIPKRFINLQLNNPYIISIDPPKLSICQKNIIESHSYYRDKVHYNK
tara:strand:- start:3988 stop:4356 length:369 start_codon:yes stop_codon:yes gene_type:complete